MDSSILQDIYEKYRKEIYLYIFGLARNKEVAEDILQETFFKALLTLGDTNSNIRAWLYKVARNLYLNHLSRQSRTNNHNNDFDYQKASIPQKEEPHNKLSDQELKIALYNAIFCLEKRKREILIMHYFSDLSLKEISEISGMTKENVRVLAHRGRLELRKKLEENGYGL